MKKLSVVSIIFVMILIGVTGYANTSVKAANTNENPSFIFVVTSQLGDRSFNDSAARGMKKIEEQLGFEVKILEIGDNQTRWEPTLLDLSDTGKYTAIIVNGSGTKEIIERIAPEFPEQKYVMFDTSIEEYSNPNVYAINYKQNEGSFLGGVLAGLVTTSDMPYANEDKAIGFIGGDEGPIISDFLVGYIEGAHSIDPEIKVHVSYVGSWTDTAKAKELANAQYSQGVDIIFPAAMTAGLGCIESAAELDKYIIGVDSDQGMLLKETDEEKANVILTSVVKEVGESLFQYAKKEVNGTMKYGTTDVMGIKERASDIVENEIYLEQVPKSIREVVDEKREALLNEEINVISALGLEQEKLDAIIESARP